MTGKLNLARLDVRWDLWVFVTFTIFFLLVFRPVLDSEFALIDDHEILRFASATQLSSQTQPPISVWEMIGSEDTVNGRVRTLFYTARFIWIDLFGTNPYLWHSAVLLMGVLTLAFFYKALRVLGIEIVPSVLGIGSVVFSPSISYNWLRLAAPETLGTLLLSLALLAAVKGARQSHAILWDTVLIVAVLGLALTKESFILTIPALVYARLILPKEYSRKSLAKTITSNRVIVITLGAIFILALAFVYFRVQIAGNQSQGGGSFVLHTESLVRLVELFADTIREAAWYVPVVLMGLVVLVERERVVSVSKVWAKVGAFCVLLVLPQLLLYATRSVFDLRYWLPAALGLIFANVSSLAWLARYRNRLAYTIGFIWLSIWLIASVRQTAFQAAWFRADTIALNRMVNYVTKNITYSRAVAIAADPAWHYEQSISMLYQIGFREHFGIPLFLLLTPSASGNTPLAESQRNALLTSYFAGHNALTDVSPDQIQAIILLSDEEQLGQSVYREALSRGQLIEFSEPAISLSLKQAGFTSITVTYRVLWLP